MVDDLVGKNKKSHQSDLFEHLWIFVYAYKPPGFPAAWVCLLWVRSASTFHTLLPVPKLCLGLNQVEWSVSEVCVWSSGRHGRHMVDFCPTGQDQFNQSREAKAHHRQNQPGLLLQVLHPRAQGRHGCWLKLCVLLSWRNTGWNAQSGWSQLKLNP